MNNKQSLKLGVNPFSKLIKLTSDEKQYVLNKHNYSHVLISDNNREVINKLSKNAKALYLYILYLLQPNQDYIEMYADEYSDAVEGCSPMMYYGAIKELRNSQIIANTDEHGHYWINTLYFFRGNVNETSILKSQFDI